MDITTRVKNLVKPKYNELECWSHKWLHVEDVAENSERLAQLENANVNSCIIAAYCHDLGRIEEEKGNTTPHAALSIEPTKNILRKVGISGEDFDRIVEAVAVHSMKKYSGKNKS